MTGDFPDGLVLHPIEELSRSLWSQAARRCFAAAAQCLKLRHISHASSTSPFAPVRQISVQVDLQRHERVLQGQPVDRERGEQENSSHKSQPKKQIVFVALIKNSTVTKQESLVSARAT